MKKVFILIRRTGCYEYTEYAVCAYPTKAKADAARDRAEAEWRAAEEAVPDTLEYPEDGASDAEWDKWERRRDRGWKRFRSMLTVDPAAAPEGAWNSPESPDYFVWEVPFAASVDTHPKGRDA